MNSARLLLTLLTLILSAPVCVSAAEPPRSPSRVIGYFTEWSVYDRKFHVADIPAERLTHVNYAFAKIVNGEVALFDSYAAIDKAYPGDTWDAGVLRGNFHQFQILKKKHPHLKVLIAVGGWTLSGPFSDMASTEAGRQKFAKSAVAFIKKYGFDGVDIDWEYPVGGGLESNKTRKEDKANYTLLLEELRKQLDDAGKADKAKYLLTIASPAGPSKFANIELEKVHTFLDWFNVMTYDFHGGWSPLTNHNAPLHPVKDDPTPSDEIRTRFNVDNAVKGYRAAGVPAEKIVVGVPYYGRGWSGVADTNQGLFAKPAATLPKGTWEAGIYDYKDLAKNYVGRMTRHWHVEAKVPWLHDPKTGLMISYDDAESIREKAEYVRNNKLGGVMVWELSGEDAEHTLTAAIAKALRPTTPKQ